MDKSANYQVCPQAGFCSIALTGEGAWRPEGQIALEERRPRPVQVELEGRQRALDVGQAAYAA